MDEAERLLYSRFVVTRLLIAVSCVVLSLAATQALQRTDQLRVWRIGSPYGGDTPGTAVPSRVARELETSGVRLDIESLPAMELAQRIEQAIAANSLPDVLVIDNYGLITGTTTQLGTFAGLSDHPRLGGQLMRVTGAFDGLLGPQRGWTYLLTGSSNHTVARRTATRAPGCGDTGPVVDLDELTSVIPSIVYDYLKGNDTFSGHADGDLLSAIDPAPEAATMRDVSVCGVWGNDKLRFVGTRASYEGPTAIGHTPVLLIFRRVAGRWQVLAASRDPISNSEFLQNLPTLVSLLESDGRPHPQAPPVLLRAPVDGMALQLGPDKRPRFWNFVWENPPSRSTVANIAEFAYKRDARFFLTVRPGTVHQISSGKLWNTRTEWKWRIWSVNSAGDISFSEVRRFLNWPLN
jgi:hypothetical protein